MDERKILRALSKILTVEDKDIPKTLMRFKKDIEEMENTLKSS